MKNLTSLRIQFGGIEHRAKGEGMRNILTTVSNLYQLTHLELTIRPQKLFATLLNLSYIPSLKTLQELKVLKIYIYGMGTISHEEIKDLGEILKEIP